MINIVTKDALAQAKPTAKNKPGFRLVEHLHFLEQSPGRTVVEFAGLSYSAARTKPPNTIYAGFRCRAVSSPFASWVLSDCVR